MLHTLSGTRLESEMVFSALTYSLANLVMALQANNHDGKCHAGFPLGFIPSAEVVKWSSHYDSFVEICTTTELEPPTLVSL